MFLFDGFESFAPGTHLTLTCVIVHGHGCWMYLCWESMPTGANWTWEVATGMITWAFLGFRCQHLFFHSKIPHKLLPFVCIVRLTPSLGEQVHWENLPEMLGAIGDIPFRVPSLHGTCIFCLEWTQAFDRTLIRLRRFSGNNDFTEAVGSRG